LENTSTKYWIDKFHKPENYDKITIPEKELSWLKKAKIIGCQTCKSPNMYNEELDDLVSNLNSMYKFKKFVFVRTESVSLKNGMYGIGPYDNFTNILKSAVTSRDGHTPIKDNITELTFYLLLWVDINKFKKFRVFVKEKK